jgi:hypothetical protein
MDIDINIIFFYANGRKRTKITIPTSTEALLGHHFDTLLTKLNNGKYPTENMELSINSRDGCRCPVLGEDGPTIRDLNLLQGYTSSVIIDVRPSHATQYRMCQDCENTVNSFV